MFRLLAIPYAGMVLMITLFFRMPTYSHNIKPPFWEIAELIRGNHTLLFDIIGNIIMFIPMGIFVPLCIRKADSLKKVAFAGFLVSVLIEITQLITTRGFFETDDMFNNTLGTLIGALIGCPLAKKLFTEEKSVRKK